MTKTENELQHQRRIAFVRATRVADDAARMAAKLAEAANTAEDYNAVVDALLVAATAARRAADAAAAYPPPAVAAVNADAVAAANLRS